MSSAFDYDLAAIDPGAKECAVALFDSSARLRGAYSWAQVDVRCAYVRRAVVEIPERINIAGVQPDDLIRAAAAGVRLAMRCVRGEGVVRELRPREWKGSVPKPVHHARMWARLYPSERIVLGYIETEDAIRSACDRGAAERWKKDGKLYYRARELPTVGGVKITHDILDAVALGLFDLGRLTK